MQGGADGGKEHVGKPYTVRGWVRTVRKQKAFSFIEVNLGCANTSERHEPFTRMHVEVDFAAIDHSWRT